MDEYRYKETDRTGLYIMVFIILLLTCDMSKEHRQLSEKIDKLEQTIKDTNANIHQK